MPKMPLVKIRALLLQLHLPIYTVRTNIITKDMEN